MMRKMVMRMRTVMRKMTRRRTFKMNRNPEGLDVNHVDSVVVVAINVINKKKRCLFVPGKRLKWSSCSPSHIRIHFHYLFAALFNEEAALSMLCCNATPK